MKAITLMFTALSLVSLTAQAGTSSEDPTVAALRGRFTAAHTPSASELRLGEAWQCRMFMTGPGEFTVEEIGPIGFKKFDGLIVQDVDKYEDPEEDVIVPKAFTFTKKGLVSVTPYLAPNAKAYVAIRAEAAKVLLLEFSIAGVTDKYKQAIQSMGLDSAIAAPAGVVNYAVCIPHEYRSPSFPLPPGRPIVGWDIPYHSK